jgi:RNA-directed DNA polymerase
LCYRRGKLPLGLAFLEEDRGEAPKDLQEGAESSTGERGAKSPAIAEQLMEEVCERENCKQALKRVKANNGSSGVDGMTVHDLPGYLKQHWPAIRDRFSNHSYGFRPGRSAHQAVAKAQQYMAEGYRWVVDLDLEKFLDTASYCPLIHESCSNSSGC